MEITDIPTLQLRSNKITSEKGYVIDTINPGEDNLYTADKVCRVVEILVDNIFAKFGGCFFVRPLGFQWKQIVPAPAS